MRQLYTVTLNELGRQIIVECAALEDKLMDRSYDKITDNFPSKLCSFRESTLSLLKRVTKYRRVAATHVLIVMISPEERNSKPYALTVQCIAYKSIKDSEIRAICNKLIKEMHARKMKVAGQLLNVTTHLAPLYLRTPPQINKCLSTTV